MKKHVKKLSALLLALAMLLVSAVPAMAEDTIYGPIDSWEYIGGDNHMTVTEGSFFDTPSWTFTNELPTTDRYAHTFKDVAPGLYEFQLFANFDGLQVEMTIDGGTYLLSQNGSPGLEFYYVPVNADATKDVTVSLRFIGVGTCTILGAGILSNGAPLPAPSLVNPGFEAGLNGWTKQGAPEVTVQSAPGTSHNGSGYATFRYSAFEGMERYLEQTVTNVAAGSYTAEAWVRAVDGALNGAGAMLLIQARDEDGTVLATTASSTVTSTGGLWQRLSATINAPVGTTQITLKVGGVYCSGAFDVDDVQIVRN